MLAQRQKLMMTPCPATNSSMCCDGHDSPGAVHAVWLVELSWARQQGAITHSILLAGALGLAAHGPGMLGCQLTLIAQAVTEAAQ